MGLFEKLKSTLSKTRQSFGESMNSLLSNFRTVDEDFLEELEETLIMADAGVEVTEEINTVYLTVVTTSKSAYQIAEEYGFTEQQKEMLTELLSSENAELWAGILGG